MYGQLGGNVSPVHTIMTRTTFAGTGKGDYKLRAGFNFGLGVEYHYDENISAALEGDFLITAYEYNQSGIFGRDNISVLDRQNWVRLPLMLRFADAVGKYRPYGYVGYSFDLLLADRGTITYSDKNFTDGRVIPDERESPVINFKPKRNFLNSSFIVGGGVKYKLGLEYAFVDLRYSMGMTNLVKVENTIERNSPEDPAFTWGYVDNLFRLNNLSLTVGYIHPLYKPRKLKKARSRSVLQKIKKESNEAKKD
jgi:opacity protein-like surface antigen